MEVTNLGKPIFRKREFCMNKNRILLRSAVTFLLIWLVILISYEATHVYGAARKVELDLPKFGTGIHAGIDHLELKTIKFKKVIKLDGWAYINRHNAETQSTYIVLYSQNNQYIFDSQKVIRNDLPAALNNDNDHVENAGLTSLIDMTRVKPGSYQIGFYIMNNDSNEFTLSNMSIIKSDSGIEFKESVNTKQNIQIQKANSKVQANLEEVSQNNGEIRLKGWIFIKGKSLEGAKVYIVLKNQDKRIIFDTEPQFRKDVTKYFGGVQDYDKSGFISNISEVDLGKGKYQIGVYIVNGDARGMYWSEESIGEE